MNARTVCMYFVVSAGFALSTGFAMSARADTGLHAAQQKIQQEQLAEFHRRSIESFPSTDLNVATASFLDTGLADEVLRETEDRIRVQGRLAQWAIQEEQLAGYRTGLLASELIARDAALIARVDKSGDGTTFGKAQGLLKSARFEWPEFMPPGLLR